MIVLDTNVVSELMKPVAAPAVLRWFGRFQPTELFLTTVTEAEILLGLTLLAEGKRRTGLEAAARSIFEEDFGGRILPFDEPAAILYPKIVVIRKRMGRPVSQFDAQIASIALSRGAAVATRNIPDFEECGLEVLDPWQSS